MKYSTFFMCLFFPLRRHTVITPMFDTISLGTSRDARRFGTMFRLFRRSAHSRNNASSSTLCPNSTLVWLRLGRRYLIILIGMGLLVTIGPRVYVFLGDALSGRTLQSFFYYFYSPSFAVAVEFLLAVFCIFGAERYWKRIEISRFAALDDSVRPFAIKQLEESIESLFLPSTVITRYKKSYVIIMEIIALLIVLLFLGLEYLFDKVFFTFLLSWPINLIMTVVVIGYMVFLGSVILRTFIAIDVTEEGIRISRNNRSLAFIAWHEALLFAHYRTWGAQKSGDAMIYELSSSSAIVRWTWVQHPNSLWSNQKPVLPIDAYQRQMQALVSFIVKRTGLPLYDLNHPLVKSK